MDIQCGKSQSSSKLFSIFHNSGNRIGIPEHLVYHLHISFTQFFSDISTADLTISIHFFLDHEQFIIIFSGIFCQHVHITAFIVPEPEIGSDHNILCVKQPGKNVTDEDFCLHTADFLCKRTLHKRIHLIFQMHTPFLVRHDPISWQPQPLKKRCHVKSKHNRLHFMRFLQLTHLMNQLLMSAVKSVKFSKCNRCPSVSPVGCKPFEILHFISSLCHSIQSYFSFLSKNIFTILNN